MAPPLRLLLDVRPALLLDEDHAGGARLRREGGLGRAGGAARGDEGEGRRVRRRGRGDLPGRAARGRAARALTKHGGVGFAVVFKKRGGGLRTLFSARRLFVSCRAFYSGPLVGV